MYANHRDFCGGEKPLPSSWDAVREEERHPPLHVANLHDVPGGPDSLLAAPALSSLTPQPRSVV